MEYDMTEHCGLTGQHGFRKMRAWFRWWIIPNFFAKPKSAECRKRGWGSSLHKASTNEDWKWREWQV